MTGGPASFPAFVEHVLYSSIESGEFHEKTVVGQPVNAQSGQAVELGIECEVEHLRSCPRSDVSGRHADMTNEGPRSFFSILAHTASAIIGASLESLDSCLNLTQARKELKEPIKSRYISNRRPPVGTI